MSVVRINSLLTTLTYDSLSNNVTLRTFKKLVEQARWTGINRRVHEFCTSGQVVTDAYITFIGLPSPIK